MTETFEINICDFIQSLYLAMYFICYCQCPLRHSSRHRSNSTTYFRKKSICKILSNLLYDQCCILYMYYFYFVIYSFLSEVCQKFVVEKNAQFLFRKSSS